MIFDALGKIGFTYRAELRDAPDGDLIWCEEIRNLFPIEGINYVLDSAIGTRAKITAWYMGIFEGDYTPQLADTGSSLPAAATESTAYTALSRPAYTPNVAANGAIANVGFEAQFTFTADKSIYGGFISSGQGKGSTLGVLLSVARFASPQIAKAGNVLSLSGGCTLVNA